MIDHRNEDPEVNKHRFQVTLIIVKVDVTDIKYHCWIVEVPVRNAKKVAYCPFLQVPTGPNHINLAVNGKAFHELLDGK